MSFSNKVKKNILDNGLVFWNEKIFPIRILWGNYLIFEQGFDILNLHHKASLLWLRICFHFLSIHMFFKKKGFLLYQKEYSIKLKMLSY